jgi:hypothetical protein
VSAGGGRAAVRRAVRPDPESEFDGLTIAEELDIPDFFPLAPNGWGDYYGLQREGERYGGTVFFADHEEDYVLRDTGNDVVAFISRHGSNVRNEDESAS